MKPLVLIVDDEPGILTTLSHILEDEGFRTITTRSGQEALQLYRRRRPAAVFLDIWLPDRDGLETLKALREMDPEAAVIMISGHGTAPTAVTAIKMGAYDYLEKPLAYSRVMEALTAALAARKAAAGPEAAPLELGKATEAHRNFLPPPQLSLLRESATPQRTIAAGAPISETGSPPQSPERRPYASSEDCIQYSSTRISPWSAEPNSTTSRWSKR